MLIVCILLSILCFLPIRDIAAYNEFYLFQSYITTKNKLLAIFLSRKPKTFKVKNTGKKTHWAFVYWNERMPCQPGDEITFTFTASGSGPVYCEAIYHHWHGNWSGRSTQTLYLTAQPKQYTVTIKVPAGGKSFKRRPMEFRPMFGVRDQMELSDIKITLKRD